MARNKDAQYNERTQYFDEHIDAIRADVRYVIAQRGLSISRAAKEAGVSRPVMRGFVQNDAYYPSTSIALRLQYFVENFAVSH